LLFSILSIIFAIDAAENHVMSDLEGGVNKEKEFMQNRQQQAQQNSQERQISKCYLLFPPLKRPDILFDIDMKDGGIGARNEAFCREREPAMP